MPVAGRSLGRMRGGVVRMLHAPVPAERGSGPRGVLQRGEGGQCLGARAPTHLRGRTQAATHQRPRWQPEQPASALPVQLHARHAGRLAMRHAGDRRTDRRRNTARRAAGAARNVHGHWCSVNRRPWSGGGRSSSAASVAGYSWTRARQRTPAPRPGCPWPGCPRPRRGSCRARRHPASRGRSTIACWGYCSPADGPACAW